MNTYTLMRTCVANTGVKNWNVSVIPESSVVPLFQAVVTHRGPAGLFPIAVDLSTSSRASSKWDHGTFSVSVGTWPWLLSLSMKPCCCQYRRILPFYFWERLCGMNIRQCVHPFCWQMLGLFPGLGYYEWILFEHSCCMLVFFRTPTLPPPRVEFLGHSVGYDSFHCHMIFLFLASCLCFLYSTL